MNARSIPRSLAVLAVVAGALAAPALVNAEGRLAEITQVTGSVVINRIDDGRVDEPSELGDRVEDGVVFAGDVVSTQAGAMARIEFFDGTQIVLTENSSVTMRDVDVSAVPDSPTSRPLTRVIKLIAGGIRCDVAASSTVMTEFETPRGVARVRGTTLVVTILANGDVEFRTVSGVVSVTDWMSSSLIAVGAGYSVTVGKSVGGTVTLSTPASSPSALSMQMGEAIASVAPGTTLDITMRSGNLYVRVLSGSVSWAVGSEPRTETSAGGEFVVRAVAPEFFGDVVAGTEPDEQAAETAAATESTVGKTTTVSTEHGEVVFTVPGSDTTIVLTDGFGVGVVESADGTFEFEIPDSNPQPLTIQIGGTTVTLEPGSVLNMAPSVDGGMVVSLVGGSMTTTDANGNAQTVRPGEAITASADSRAGAEVFLGETQSSTSSTTTPTTTIATTEGEVVFTVPGTDTHITLTDGFSVDVRENPDGGYSFEVPDSNPGSLRIQIGDTMATIEPGSEVTMMPGAGGDIEIDLAGGSMTTTDANGNVRTIGSGESVTASAPQASGEVFVGETQSPTTTVSTEEGEVVFTVPGTDTTVTLTDGFSIGVVESDDGSLEFEVPDTNPGSLTVQIGDTIATIEPGSEVTMTTGPDGEITIELDGGSMTTTDADGNVTVLSPGDTTTSGDSPPGSPGDGESRGKTDSPPPLTPETVVQRSCGECQVPDGIGGCIDVDALCPNETCLVDRVCRAGVCIGGRRLTGADDLRCQDPNAPPPPPPSTPTPTPPPPVQQACGECQVPDGFGGCTDVNALCPDEICLVDQVCGNGFCIGGRRLTSDDDPRCALN